MAASLEVLIGRLGNPSPWLHKYLADYAELDTVDLRKTLSQIHDPRKLVEKQTVHEINEYLRNNAILLTFVQYTFLVVATVDHHCWDLTEYCGFLYKLIYRYDGYPCPLVAEEILKLMNWLCEAGIWFGLQRIEAVPFLNFILRSRCTNSHSKYTVFP